MLAATQTLAALAVPSDDRKLLILARTTAP
jgi:hypothetical protein